MNLMKKSYFIIILTISLVAGLFAETDFYGYFEGEADLIKMEDTQIYFGYNKFRLDLNSFPSDNITIGANVIFKHFDGTTLMNFMDFVDKSYYPVFPNNLGGLDTLSYFPYELADTLFLDNIYLEFHHQLFDLTLGRQQLPSGVGYTWNPTDIFNQKDMMDPTYENQGIDAIQIQIPYKSLFTFRGILQPENKWKRTTQYYEIKSLLGNFDISLLYAQQIDMSTDQFFQANYFKRKMGGFNAEGDLFGFGVRTEIAINEIDNDTDNLKYEYIIGGDYTFENSLYTMVEYYHNDFGVKAEETTFFDYTAFFSWERKSLNQNYLFGMAMYPITDLIDGAFFGIYNFDDQSIVINPQIVYRIYQDVELTFMGNLFFGEESDEFGYQDIGGRIRLRAYF